MNKEEHARNILKLTIGHYEEDIVSLALQAHDMIIGDRLTIKILSRNIESLTMQMKNVTQVTFERDTYKEGMEAQKEILANVVEERNALRLDVEQLRVRLQGCEERNRKQYEEK
jgi:regulator of replication initiation timing